MGLYIRDIGRMTREMGKVALLILMETSTKASEKGIKGGVMVL
jgi:hypothetical protein